MLHLTAEGRKQALDAGQRLKSLIGDDSVSFIVSPYTRTKETFNGIKQAWGSAASALKTREDVRIREQEFGNYDHPDMKELHQKKKQFGPFYFRFPDGESPADCYDRASSFFETMYRYWTDSSDNNQVIVGHGMMILMMLMRLMRFSIAEWEGFESLSNCEFVVLERAADDAKYHISYTWQGGGQPKDTEGLRRKCPKKEVVIWDGNPDAPLFSNAVDPVAAEPVSGYPASS
jgi:broad specificity phosphatase PhoE